MPWRIVSIVTALVLIGSTSAPAQSGSPRNGAATARSDDEAALRRNEDGWAAALVKRDRAYFEKTLAEHFIYTEDDRLMTRADVLRDATSGTDGVSAARNEDMTVHLFGSTGVVTGLLIVRGNGSSGAFEHRYRFTDTWAKQPDGEWKIVAAQDYLIPGK